MLRVKSENGGTAFKAAKSSSEVEVTDKPATMRPNIRYKETVVNLAKMTNDAYVMGPRQPDWLNTSLGSNFTYHLDGNKMACVAMFTLYKVKALGGINTKDCLCESPCKSAIATISRDAPHIQGRIPFCRLTRHASYSSRQCKLFENTIRIPDHEKRKSIS